MAKRNEKPPDPYDLFDKILRSPPEKRAEEVKKP